MPLDVQTIDDAYFNEDFKVMIRSNKEFLIANAQDFPITDKALLVAHRYNFYNVLRISSKGAINPAHAWVIAFINGIINPDTDISKMTSYLFVDFSIISKMIARANTERK